MGTDDHNAGGNLAIDKHSIQGGVAILERLRRVYGKR